MKLSDSLTKEQERALNVAVLGAMSEQTEKLRRSAAGELPQREPREHYVVHDHAGTRCPSCGAAIARVSFSDHDLFYCPGCQTGGEPLKKKRPPQALQQWAPEPASP